MMSFSVSSPSWRSVPFKTNGSQQHSGTNPAGNPENLKKLADEFLKRTVPLLN
jgi:hypothetical protein